jgi:hypothetical protein
MVGNNRVFMRRWLGVSAAVALLGTVQGCGTPSSGGSANPDDDVTPPPPGGELVLNEVMSQNDGAWIDERGETHDWIELVNRGTERVRLSDHWLADGSGARVRLSGGSLLPGERRLLWADDDESLGAGHLPFKLDAGGERLVLSDELEQVLDEVEVPALATNTVLARHPDATGALGVCRYASPQANNGSSCVPPAPPVLQDDVSFELAALPESFPPAPAGVLISELALRPAAGGQAFIELYNGGASAVLLDELTLSVSTHAPHLPWPGPLDGSSLPLPAGQLAPGERRVVDIAPSALAALEADPSFEGVLTLWRNAESVARVDFMSWPSGAALMQLPGSLRYRYCTNTTPAAADDCEPLASRPVGERLRHLRTPSDFSALAAGGDELGIRSVKFIDDLSAPGLVHLLSSARWPLHYTFVRERVYLEPVLDRCDAAQNSEFYRGWVEFSESEYYRVEGRRFLLGTLTHHGGSDLHTVEYTTGDVISSAQMREGFVSAVAHTDAPGLWSLRPQDRSQIERARRLEGELPIVGPNAPFEGVTYQPLTEGIAYGTLRFISAGDLESAALGPDIILVTDDVPNDIPLVGGLITEAFQTPLAHVNVLSQNRGTPNAGLRDARTELAASLEQLVRLEVSAGGLTVEPADADEARAFWDSRAPTGPRVAARLDTSVRGVQALAGHGLGSLPAIGAKAAQLAELGRDRIPYCGTLSVIRTPESPFAIPLVHSLEHLERSGARALLDELAADDDFVADPRARARGLQDVRARILAEPVEPTLLAEVEEAVRSRFGDGRVRFRSSSNTEDLPGFNGAGLYTSIAAELGDDSRRVEDALRTVWASLYNARAYDERTYARVDESSVAMGVLVHDAFSDEQANGVAVSRNVLEPTRGDIYYLNAQVGEASVTNPAPGVATEQLVYRWGRQPPIFYQSASSLLGAFGGERQTALDESEVVDLSCALRTIHEAFQPLLDPEARDAWFAMEVEFKFLGPDRQLLIKQARPHSFGRPATYTDCREL